MEAALGGERGMPHQRLCGDKLCFLDLAKDICTPDVLVFGLFRSLSNSSSSKRSASIATGWRREPSAHLPIEKLLKL